MAKKEIREFEKPKRVPYSEVLPYSVAKVEFGASNNFVRIIIRGFKIEKNGDICIMYSWPTSPRKIEKMYDLSQSMSTEIEVVGVYA